MTTVSVTVAGLGPKFIQTQIQKITNIAQRQIKEIAYETERVIRQKIKESIEREGSTGNLADSFFAFPMTDGYGVGNIDYLNTNAKAWHWQNYGIAQSGRKVPPRSRGQFRTGSPAPASGGGNSRWNQSSTGQYMINPTKAITAKNYIQKTVNEINQIISSVLKRG